MTFWFPNHLYSPWTTPTFACVIIHWAVKFDSFATIGEKIDSLMWTNKSYIDQRRYRADRDHLGLGSRAFLHYLTTSVATGKTTLPCDDNGLNRLIKACFPVHCDGTVEVAENWSTTNFPVPPPPLKRLRRSSNGVTCGRLKAHLTY